MGSFQALLVNTVFFSSQKQTPWCSSTSLPPNACVTGGDCGQKRGRQLYYKLLLPLQVKSLRKSRVLNLGGNLLRQEISLYPLQAFWYWRPSFLGGCIAFLSFCFEIDKVRCNSSNCTHVSFGPQLQTLLILGASAAPNWLWTPAEFLTRHFLSTPGRIWAVN